MIPITVQDLSKNFQSLKGRFVFIQGIYSRGFLFQSKQDQAMKIRIGRSLSLLDTTYTIGRSSGQDERYTIDDKPVLLRGRVFGDNFSEGEIDDVVHVYMEIRRPFSINSWRYNDYISEELRKKIADKIMRCEPLTVREFLVTQDADLPSPLYLEGICFFIGQDIIHLVDTREYRSENEGILEAINDEILINLWKSDIYKKLSEKYGKKGVTARIRLYYHPPMTHTDLHNLPGRMGLIDCLSCDLEMTQIVDAENNIIEVFTEKKEDE